MAGGVNRDVGEANVVALERKIERLMNR